jgi:hypothetical protein
VETGGRNDLEGLFVLDDGILKVPGLEKRNEIQCRIIMECTFISLTYNQSVVLVA